MEVDIIDTDNDEIKRRLYFIENKLSNLESKIETIYQNTVLINNNINKSEITVKQILEQIWFFTNSIFIKFFNIKY
tara:strand:+ start:59 stop:286 length:228 start_codon:yes stop_codon:yes gene_type:complete